MRISVPAAVLLLAAAPAGAQVTITRVLSQGDPAPGASGTFNGPQVPACQAAGRVALDVFLANVPNPGVANEGVWQGTAGGMSLVALRDTPLPTTGAANVSVVSNPLQNRSGATLFAGSVNIGPNFRKIFFAPGAPAFGLAQVAVSHGDAAPGVPGGTFNSPGIAGLSEYALGDSGAIAFISSLNGVPSGTERALFTGDAATRSYTLVAQQGSPTPLPGAPVFNFITTPSINAAGDVAFFSSVSSPPSVALFVKPASGPLQSVVALGDPAPGFVAGTTFTFFVGQNSGPPAFNTNGQFAISAGVSGPNGVTNGLWRGVPGNLQLLAKRFDPAVGHPNPGATFNDFTPLINRSGAVLFYVSTINNGLSQSAGIWIATPSGAPRVLALLGSQAPGMTPGILLQSISSGGVSFNNRGEGLINASMNYVVGSTPANGLFAGRPGRLRKVVASGDTLEVAPGVTRTVTSVLAWSWNSPDTGREISINDRGEVAFSCSFVGGGGGTFIARLPDPCPGDATGDDMVTFADLSIVLANFGAVVAPGAPGDLNGDGVINFADLSLILGNFGATC